MASPDFFPFVDLTVYDAEEEDLFADALNRLKINLPDWQPREGNMEVMLLESFAAVVSENVYAINRLPSGIMQALLKFFSVERDYGSLAQCNVTFFMNSDVGFTIPAGTRFSVPAPNGDEPVVFTTDIDLEIFVGANNGTVAATAEDYTDVVNGVIPSTPVSILDSIIYADYALIATTVGGGRSAEDDEEYYERAVNRFARLTDTLVVPNHFTAYALENPNVTRATTVDAYNPANDPDNNGPSGNDAGHVTVAVRGVGGVNLTSDQKNELLGELQENAQSNLTIHVVDPTVTLVSVTATVVALPGYTETDVQENVEIALANYLDPEQWGWGTVVRHNELISLIDQTEGVDYVVSLTAPAGDLALNGMSALAQLDTTSITVNLP